MTKSRRCQDCRKIFYTDDPTRRHCTKCVTPAEHQKQQQITDDYFASMDAPADSDKLERLDLDLSE